jgi:glycerol-3-phosphate O-acyltransferase
MVWRTQSDTGAEAEGLVWDLRQIYAKELVGSTLKAIQQARVTENYSQWYHLLKRDLFTEIRQKLDNKEADEVVGKISEVKKILVKNNQAFLKKSNDEKQHEEIEEALCDLEMLMRILMDKKGMFGVFQEDEGMF